MLFARREALLHVSLMHQKPYFKMSHLKELGTALHGNISISVTTAERPDSANGFGRLA